MGWTTTDIQNADFDMLIKILNTSSKQSVKMPRQEASSMGDLFDNFNG